MSNIPYLAAHLEKRSGKEEAFSIIKRSINGEKLIDHDWAVMYSYFLPPSPKKITNPFEWVSMVCDQKESYAFCKYVLIDNGKMIAANTKVAHILFDDLTMPNGWYDIKKGAVGNDIAIMPNIDQVLIQSSISNFNFINGDSFDIVDAPTGLSYVLPWNGKGVDKNYFDIMTKSIDNISIQYSSEGPFKVEGIISSVKCAAVIMPFKIHGLGSQEETEKDQETEKPNEEIENKKFEVLDQTAF